MDKNVLKIPCNVMPFVCEADHSVTLGQMIHADRIAPFHVVIYLLRGSMEIIEDGICYRLMPHQLFFLKSGVHHWGEKPFEEGSAWYYAHFYCPEPGPQMKRFSLSAYHGSKLTLDLKEKEKYLILPKLTDCKPTGHIRQNFEKLIEAHNYENIPQVSIKLWQIFLECVENDIEDPVGNHTVRKIQAYIHAHYIDNFTAKEMEAACSLSYKYAGTLFKEATGQTIRQYQRMLRIRRAKQLLEETDTPVTEIAQMTGFSDVFYFSRIFHAEQGCSPSEYRRTYVPGI